MTIISSNWANTGSGECRPVVESFDAAFFGYSPREAMLVDPQHRLFLEVAWETLESAGYVPDQMEQPVGVYAGAGSHITSYHAAHPLHPLLRGETAGIEHISNDTDFLSTRVPYKLNLKGPSLTVQTACSTSLVACLAGSDSALRAGCGRAFEVQGHRLVGEQALGDVGPDTEPPLLVYCAPTVQSREDANPTTLMAEPRDCLLPLL